MREKYESLSLTTLKDLAKARGLKGISTLRKPELIERMLQEDAAEVSNKAAEVREITHEETVRQENRARESRPSYESNERKTYQERNYQEKIIRIRRLIRNVQIIRTEIPQIRHSLTVERKQMVFWRCFRMAMDLFAVRIIFLEKMIFMCLRRRFADSI